MGFEKTFRVRLYGRASTAHRQTSPPPAEQGFVTQREPAAGSDESGRFDHLGNLSFTEQEPYTKRRAVVKVFLGQPCFRSLGGGDSFHLNRPAHLKLLTPQPFGIKEQLAPPRGKSEALVKVFPARSAWFFHFWDL
ncbi:MAG: hypothetical protein AB1641_04455 [Thermodesulfobacteriota bacterium]